MPQFQRGDVTLHYELDGAGAPAVFISGLGAHSNDLLGMMVRQGMATCYQVLAVDNRGSGQTVTGADATVTLEAMADDIAALMDHHQMGAADVVGISMGGCVAMILALRHPEKVRRLVLAVSLAKTNLGASRSAFYLQTTWAMRDQGIPRELINRFTATFLMDEAAFEDAGLIDAWVNSPDDPLRQTRADFDRQLAALENYDITEPIKTIRALTLVMSSPGDELVPPRFQDEIHSLIPNAQIKRYPGGHVFMLLPQYHAQFMQDIFAFFAS